MAKLNLAPAVGKLGLEADPTDRAAMELKQALAADQACFQLVFSQWEDFERMDDDFCTYMKTNALAATDLAKMKMSVHDGHGRLVEDADVDHIIFPVRANFIFGGEERQAHGQQKQASSPYSPVVTPREYVVGDKPGDRRTTLSDRHSHLPPQHWGGRQSTDSTFSLAPAGIAVPDRHSHITQPIEAENGSQSDLPPNNRIVDAGKTGSAASVSPDAGPQTDGSSASRSSTGNKWAQKLAEKRASEAVPEAEAPIDVASSRQQDAACWEIESRDSWISAPFKPPETITAGKTCKFEYAGLAAEVEFTSSSTGIVRCKGQEYQCRLQAIDRASVQPEFSPDKDLNASSKALPL